MSQATLYIVTVQYKEAGDSNRLQSYVRWFNYSFLFPLLFLVHIFALFKVIFVVVSFSKMQVKVFRILTSGKNN